MKKINLLIAITFLFAKATTAQVWNGSTISTTTNDNVTVGSNTNATDAKLKIKSGYDINSCSYVGQDGIKLEWNDIGVQPLCMYGVTGNMPNAVYVYSPGYYYNFYQPSTLMKLTGDGRFSLGGDPKTYFHNSFYGTSYFDNNVQVVGKLRIGNLQANGAYSNYALSVDGSIICKKAIVQTSSWADFVFNNNYNLMPLNKVEEFIQTNKHLPSMPTENDIIEGGQDVAQIQKLQQQKIEELTLYLIQLKKQNEDLQLQINNLKKQ